MKFFINLFITFFAVLFFTAGSAFAQPTLQSTNSWSASYWNNIDLSGDPVLVRAENDLFHQWGDGSPVATVGNDRFSARWTRTLTLTPGRYRFELTADDGARLFVDGQLLIDAWQVQPETTYTAETVISDSAVPVEVQYFENTGLATIQLSWTAVQPPSGLWQAEYFDNQTLSGSPAFVRDEPAINYDWGATSPAPGILNPDAFSVRWRRTLDLPAGNYRFTMTVDDGGRLRVDGQTLIDAFYPQPATTYEAHITLSGEPVTIEMDYYENGGVAQAGLSWQLVPNLPPPTPPAPPVDEQNVVDNSSFNFSRGGPDAEWTTEAEGYNGSLFWTQNSRTAADTYNWGVWYPDLEVGTYQVAAFIPERFSTTSQARYWVSHANGFDLTIVDQSVNGGRWVTLGTYQFDGSDNDYVSLADVTFEDNQSRLVAYDAMRFVPVDNSEAQEMVILNVAFAGPGDVVQASRSGFPPGQTVYLRLGPPETEPFGQYAQGVVSADGTASLEFVVPNTWPNGEQIVAAELVVLLITQDGTSGRASFTYTG